MSDTTPLSTEALEALIRIAKTRLNPSSALPCAAEDELAALRTGIAEAVKAAEEATREEVARECERRAKFCKDEARKCGMATQSAEATYNAEQIRKLNHGALDRYVASKVRAVAKAIQTGAYLTGPNDDPKKEALCIFCGQQWEQAYGPGCAEDCPMKAVASKVREAKVAAYERAGSIVSDELDGLVCVEPVVKLFAELAAAERKEAGQ